MNAIIERIIIYPAKGAAGMILGEARLIEGVGLEGNFRAKGDGRQVSLLSAEKRKLLEDANEKGLCFPRQKENISIRGLGDLESGMRIEAGEAVLEVSGEAKHCYSGCVLFDAGKSCPLAGQHLFARVLKGGVIRAGEPIVLQGTR